MLRNFHIWLPGYIASRKRGEFVSPTHLFFCFVDHFEPLWGKPSREVARARVRHWLDNYPKLARFRDVDGRPPQHTWFYPAEEYAAEFLEPLAALSREGFGEVEIHLHHRNDTAENLRATLEDFKVKLRGHGFLGEVEGPRSKVQGSDPRTAPPTSGIQYGFIHGNWCLDNSRADGDWCGVNNELQVLRETGCYADFTLPSAPSDTQTRKVNSIYYATDDPLRPKSHDTGADVRVQSPRPDSPESRVLSPESNTASVAAAPALPTANYQLSTASAGDLLIIQGPLALNWRRRKWGLLPRLEAGNIAGHCRPSLARARLWLRQRIGVIGKPDWIFVKVHTHGCQEANFAAALDGALHECLAQLPVRLHYVTAREMYNLVKAAEAGLTGDPNQYRDLVLAPPPVRL